MARCALVVLARVEGRSMDVYDFDGTLYKGDSTADFLKFCLRRHPGIASTLPRTGIAACAAFGVHAIDESVFKTQLYRFLPRIPDIEREVELFWRLKGFLALGGPCNPKRGDLVISASPEFLLQVPCALRGFCLIASRVDPHTGNLLSRNCSGEEKVNRFRERFPEGKIERFFSDSRKDDPLAHLAREAYMVNVRKGELAPWPLEGKSVKPTQAVAR